MDMPKNYFYEDNDLGFKKSTTSLTLELVNVEEKDFVTVVILN